MATILASQSDSYPKPASQSNHADVPLVPRHLRTISAHAHDHGRDQSCVTSDFFAPQARLGWNALSTALVESHRRACVAEYKLKPSGNGGERIDVLSDSLFWLRRSNDLDPRT